MPDVRLTGCSSRSLAGYLKALGVLRVVAQQVDSEAQGRWRNEVFELRSTLDLDSLEQLLLNEYRPSPILSPWNGGSGFHPGDASAGKALREIETREHPRFAALRTCIGVVRKTLRDRGITDKPSPQQKPDLLLTLRAVLPDDGLTWLDCTTILGDAEPAFAPMLGSGGNDGRFEFSGNYLQALVALFDAAGQPTSTAKAQVAGALSRSNAPGVNASVGHWVRDSSPRNSSSGGADNLANTWDIVLALEGALLLVAGAVRRAADDVTRQAVAPFTTAPTPAGYGTASADERAFAELWLPLWSTWTALPELSALARESRMTVGRRAARSGLDALRAIRGLGVAAGITSFARFLISERAGQARLATFIRAHDVRYEASTGLLTRLEAGGWLDAVIRLRQSGTAGQRQAAARLQRCAYAFVDRPEPEQTQALLRAVAEVELVLAVSGGVAGLRPVSLGAGREWLDVADDGSPEVAYAVGLASLRQGRQRLAIRDHLLGTSVDARGRRAYEHQSLVPARAAAPLRIAEITRRRFLDALRDDEPLAARSGVPVPLADLRAVARGAVDLERALGLAAGLALADWRDGGELAPRVPAGPAVAPAMELLALAWHGRAIDEEIHGPQPTWPALLRSGNREAIEGVLADAHLRLRLAGRRPPLGVEDLQLSVSDTDIAGQLLLAAALVTPRRGDLSEVAERLAPKPPPKE